MFDKKKTADKGEQPHIGVIGAGLAGLRCADILMQYGFKVTILEGRNRIGGRVHQVTLQNGHAVDLGPNWIHGTKDNPILDIATETKTETGSWDTRSYMFDESGALLSLEESERYASIMWSIIQDAFEYSNKHGGEITPDESLWDFFNREIVQRIPQSEDGHERARKMVLQVAEMWGAFVGSPIQTQSLKYFWLEECIEGENLFCAGTYQKILRSIAKPALDTADVKFEKVVSNISCRDGYQRKVRVQTKGDEVFEFDHVVLTAPLGWLKKNSRDAFDPPLPPRMVKAIDSLGYGCLEKTYITFPKAFWLDTVGGGRGVQGFCQWLSPAYANNNPRRWNQEVVDLASLPESSSHPTLLFYTFGDTSKFLTREVSELDSQEKKDAFLFDFFKPYYSRLPHYNDSSPECRPTGCLATDWLHDDLAGNGSYTNFQVGLENGDSDVEVLREGLADAGLWLAGEHTAPFVALGTATGAYWSGESAGRRIAEFYGFIRNRRSSD
ncbi:related to anon-37cs protein [Cephalotrichum gorgonifer]|uniref:Related to anon-37cs protein n=1 Tax=Cephalotrichum gorgonifer TaxID=2041049 RepID=A0AAE8SRH5_9PEZI|nr:related to anon-37cs protein [Cephalotrichum gorgonifer]